MKLKIQNEVIEVSEEKKTYCLMLKEFQTKVREVKDFYEKGYKKFGNLKNLVEGIGELTDDTIEEAYKSVAYLYEKYAKIKINSDMFYKLFLPKMEECFGKFDDYYNEKYDEFDQVRIRWLIVKQEWIIVRDGLDTIKLVSRKQMPEILEVGQLIRHGIQWEIQQPIYLLI